MNENDTGIYEKKREKKNFRSSLMSPKGPFSHTMLDGLAALNRPFPTETKSKKNVSR